MNIYTRVSIFFIISMWLCCSGIALAGTTKQVVIHRVGAGQIRIEQGHGEIAQAPVSPPPTVTPPPIIEPPVITPPPVVIVPNPPPPAPLKIYEQLELILKLIPSDTLPDGKPRLGIYYDASQPFTYTNPVRIYNKEKGGYYSVYFDKDDFLQIGVGAVPNGLNGLRPLDPNERIDINNLSFQDSATLDVQYGRRDKDNFIISENDSLTLDVLPRARSRYGMVTTTFSFNNIYIPAGSIVVGTRNEGLENVGRPELKDMENLRFYSPDGVLLNIIGNNDKPNIDCGKATKAECFNFQQFYQPEGTTEFGARLFATYNPRYLFPGKTAQQANKLWLDVQKDLESNTLLNINGAKEPWNQRILSDLNDQEKVYIINQSANMTELEYMVNVLGYQLRSSLNLRDPNSINAVCGRDLRMLDTDDRDTALNKSYDDMFCKLSSLSKAKIAKWTAEKDFKSADKVNKGSKQDTLNVKINEQQKAKVDFDTANITYIDELKNGALKHKPLVTFTPPPPVTPPVVVIDEDAGLDMPTKCAKPKNKALKVCRPYYNPPADCINKKGNLKNTPECEGYKEPTPIIEPPPVVVPPAPPPVVVPAPKPAPAPTPAPKKKK